MLPSPHRKKYAPPETQNVKALAYAYFVIAGIWLVMMFVNAGVDQSEVDRSLDMILSQQKGIPGAKEISLELRRKREIKEAMTKHLAITVPVSKAHGPANQIADLLLSALMIASGTFLLQRAPIGKDLSLVYAGLSLAQKIANIVYLSFSEVPARTAFLEDWAKTTPADSELIQNYFVPLFQNGPLFQLIFAAFPILVIVVMMQASTDDYLRPKNVPEADPDRFVNPPAPQAVPQPFSTSDASSGLDALLKKQFSDAKKPWHQPPDQR